MTESDWAGAVFITGLGVALIGGVLLGLLALALQIVRWYRR